jgi:casein kinase I family protein HRR25
MDGPITTRFLMGPRIGKGSFGEIYKGEDIITHAPVAIKLESLQTRSPQLDHEVRVYQTLAGGVGIPSVHFYGTAPSGLHEAMVIDLLSGSLEDLLVRHKVPFSIRNVLMMADQMISCLEWVHRHHLLHRDVKPDNFMLGLGAASSQIFVIDFGLSKRFEDPRTRAHVPFATGKNLTGTARYASINAMRGFEQSRRDDMESLGYVFIYLLKGCLPWQGLPAKTQKEKLEKILAVKSETSIATLCEGLPDEFAMYISKTRSLEFEEEPEYSEYRRLFRELFVTEGYLYDGVFDRISASPVTIQVEAKTRATENTPSAEMSPAQRGGKRIHVTVAPQSGPKMGLPVLPSVPRQPPLAYSRRLGYTVATSPVSPRPPPDMRSRVVLPVLVH